MKIKVVANELVGADISAVSLVKHGANRTPFAIVKTEEGIEDISIGEKISKMFGKKKKEKFKAAAFYVKKGQEAKYSEQLKGAGFDINFTEEDGLMVAKQGDLEVKSAIQINADIAVGFDGEVDQTAVKKYFESCCYGSTDFTEALNGQMFGPSLSMATEALRSTLYAILDASESPADASTKIQTALNAFTGYISSIVESTPVAVFKFESESLHKNIGADNLNANESSGGDMTKLKEAVAGDLEGLEKTEVTPTTAVVKEETEEEKKARLAKEKEELEKADAAKAAELAKTSDMSALAKSIADLAAAVTASVAKNEAAVATLAAKLEEVEKTATTAVKKSDAVVVAKGHALDESLAHMGGRGRGGKTSIEKSDDIWAGTLPGLESFGRGN